MLSRANEIKNILEQYPQYQETLFCRGYLVTSKIVENLNEYPFYNQWLMKSCGVMNDGTDVDIYYHKLQDCSVYEEDGMTIAIIGHAYNPFNMKYQEVEILKDCLNAYKRSREVFFEEVSELTGIHLILLNDKDRLIFVQDCAGMKSCYFGKVKDDIYITSHPQLVGDICDLQPEPFVEKLVKSRCYNIGNRHLPGNITPFKEMKRLGGNTYTEYTGEFRIKRFYPVKPHDEIKSQEQFDVGIEKIFNIMHRNIELATKKWERPAISLSGGMDSKTTLACANGLYDKFSFFSFHCKPQEIVDANAAHKICEEIGLEHKIYPIAKNNDEVKDFDVLKKIIDHNTSYFKNTADHEIRKMIFLYHLNAYDIELKS
jgi:asparagine synthetase B (glutamine-hydrolysing)